MNLWVGVKGDGGILQGSHTEIKLSVIVKEYTIEEGGQAACKSMEQMRSTLSGNCCFEAPGRFSEICPPGWNYLYPFSHLSLSFNCPLKCTIAPATWVWYKTWRIDCMLRWGPQMYNMGHNLGPLSEAVCSRNLNEKQIWSWVTWIVCLKSLECTRMARPNPENLTAAKSWYNALNGIRPNVTYLSKTPWPIDLTDLSLVSIFSFGCGRTAFFMLFWHMQATVWQPIHVGQSRMVSKFPWTLLSWMKEAISHTSACSGLESLCLADKHDLYIGYVSLWQCKSFSDEHIHK